MCPRQVRPCNRISNASEGMRHPDGFSQDVSGACTAAPHGEAVSDYRILSLQNAWAREDSNLLIAYNLKPYFYHAMKTRKIMTAAICGFSRPLSLYAHAPSVLKSKYGIFSCSAGRTRTAGPLTNIRPHLRLVHHIRPMWKDFRMFFYITSMICTNL